MSDTIKNLFVSHHHKDDASVDGLTSMVAGKGYQLRNSSIRVKQENQKRLDQKMIKEPRPGRILTDQDILHYRRIIVALTETQRLMTEIDKAISAHGGWPKAFA